MSYKIPLFKLNFGEEEVNAVSQTIRGGWISSGPKCEELEHSFIEMFDVKYAISLDNCTNALHLALLANNIGSGAEVICPSYSFAASVNCIRYVGATPVFCDVVGPHHINIDPKEIEKKVTNRTKAIIVVHMAGFPAKMDEIMEIAKIHNLKVIEDACHAPLSEFNGHKLGTIGDVGCFSFFSNKNISTGEGGMLITNDKILANRVRLLRSHGMTTMSYQRANGHATNYDIVELGYNYRLDDIRASIGIIQMQKLKDDIRSRISIRENYISKLGDMKGVIIPFASNSEFVSNYIMPIVLENSTMEKRNSVRNRLHLEGIQTSVHYPAIHRFEIYKKYTANLPQTEYISDNEITLPMFSSLKDEEIDFIIETLESAINE